MIIEQLKKAFTLQSESEYRPLIDHLPPTVARTLRWGIIGAATTFEAWMFASKFIEDSGNIGAQVGDLLRGVGLTAATAFMGYFAEKAYNIRRTHQSVENR